MFLFNYNTEFPNTHTHKLSVSKAEASAYSAYHIPKYSSLPYVKGLSVKLTGILKPFNVTIAPRNTNDLLCFFKLAKDPIPKNDTADVVYNNPCSGCTATYSGTIKRPLITRIVDRSNNYIGLARKSFRFFSLDDFSHSKSFFSIANFRPCMIFDS